MLVLLLVKRKVNFFLSVLSCFFSSFRDIQVCNCKFLPMRCFVSCEKTEVRDLISQCPDRYRVFREKCVFFFIASFPLLQEIFKVPNWVYSPFYWLAIFCTTNSNPVVTREKWQNAQRWNWKHILAEHPVCKVFWYTYLFQRDLLLWRRMSITEVLHTENFEPSNGAIFSKHPVLRVRKRKRERGERERERESGAFPVCLFCQKQLVWGWEFWIQMQPNHQNF